jgi:hypothetical protein
VLGEKMLLTEKLNRIPKGVLTPRQRFLVEQVAWGRDTFEELLGYFGGDPRYLRYRVLGPLSKKGVLIEAEGTYSVDFEALEDLFVESGGEELLRAEMGAVEGERARQRLGSPELAVEDPEDVDDWPRGWGWYAVGDPMHEELAKSPLLVGFEDPDIPAARED